MNNLNNNNQMVNEVKRESEIAVEAVNYRTKNIQNFGFSIDACEWASPIILKVFVQDETSIEGARAKVGYALVRLHDRDDEVKFVTWWICNRIEDGKKTFFAEHGHYFDSFEPTVEEYRKRLREAEEDFNERVKGMISPWFDSYIKSTDECHIKSTRKEIIK
jgi:hypothetical protein